MLGSIASQFARIKTKNLVSGWLHGLVQGYHDILNLVFRPFFRRVKHSLKEAYYEQNELYSAR